MMMKAWASPPGTLTRSPAAASKRWPSTSYRYPFQNAKYFGFAVPMEGRTESRRVGGLQDSESFSRNLWRQPQREVETKRGYFESRRAIGCGIENWKGTNVSSSLIYEKRNYLSVSSKANLPSTKGWEVRGLLSAP